VHVVRGIAGSSLHAGTKDALVLSETDRLHHNHIVYMVDRDYTLDMNDILTRVPDHLLLYTATPTRAAGKTLDSTYWFLDNVYHEIVPGGSHYSHTLWDYGIDHVNVYRKTGILSGVYRAYRVERRRSLNTPDRSIVLFEMAIEYSGFYGYIAHKLYGTSPLQRYSPLDQGFNVVNSFTGNALNTSIAHNGGHFSATVPVSFVDVVRNAQDLMKSSVSSHSVKAAASALNLKLSTPEAQLLISYVKNTEFGTPVETANTVTALVVYQITAPDQDYEPDRPAIIQSFMKPIGPPAYAAQVTKATARAALIGRLTQVMNGKLSMPADLARSAEEFAKLIFPVAGTLEPLTFAEAYDTLKRPSQKAKHANARHDDPYETGDVIACFQKREAAAKYADVRNISPLAAATQANMTRYTNPLSKHAKNNLPWYSFGRTPAAIARHIAKVLPHHRLVFLGDLSRMDGRVSTVGRIVTEMIYRRGFKPSPELDAMLKGKTDRPLKCAIRGTEECISIETSGTSRLSGEAGTSFDNTAEGAFMAFHSFYKMYGCHVKAATALNSCLFGGDDSFMPGMAENNYKLSGRALGHVVTGETIWHGQPGVNFLSRFFSPQVWLGDDSSCSDILRQVRKFHTTASTGCTPRLKLLEKARSFALTDWHTPIIGDIVRQVHLVQGGFVALKFDDTHKSERWWDRYPIEVQFPNREGTWMQDIVTETMPEFNYGGFQEWILSCKTLEDIMEGYGMVEDPRPKPADVVSSIIEDDTLLLPRNTFDHKYVDQELGDRPRLRARHLSLEQKGNTQAAKTRGPGPATTAKRGGRGRGARTGRPKPTPLSGLRDGRAGTAKHSSPDKPVTNTGPGKATEGCPKALKTVEGKTAAPPSGRGGASIRGCTRPPKRRRKRGKPKKKTLPTAAVP
jgi:hypothetical protein